MKERLNIPQNRNAKDIVFDLITKVPKYEAEGGIDEKETELKFLIDPKKASEIAAKAYKQAFIEQQYLFLPMVVNKKEKDVRIRLRTIQELGSPEKARIVAHKQKIRSETKTEGNTNEKIYTKAERKTFVNQLEYASLIDEYAEIADKPVTKTRYYLTETINGIPCTVHLDRYTSLCGDQVNDKWTVEIEFTTNEQAVAFAKAHKNGKSGIDWLGKNVSDDENYKNWSIFRKGWPKS